MKRTAIITQIGNRVNDPASARRIISVVLIVFISLGIAYSIVSPLHEATDELRHFRFVRTIATTGRLPVQGKEPCRSQSHHPPLFYALGAAATAWIDGGDDICAEQPANPFWGYRYWEVGSDNKNMYLHGSEEAFPWYGNALAAHLVRFLNVLFGAGVVWFTWASGMTIWPKRPAIALGAVAFVAFNPMFLYLSGAINNDIIAALSGAAVTYVCVRLLRDPALLTWRWGLWLGAVYGIALMSKFNLAPVILLIEAAITWAAWQKPYPETADQRPRRGPLRLWLEVNALMLLVAGLVAGWWFARNQILYGEPTGFQEVTELWGVRDPLQSVGLAISELPYAWTTLWGRFGFGQIPLPPAAFQALKILSAAGLVGALVGFFRQASGRERVILLFLAGNVLLFFAVLFNYMLVSPAGPNGRFFFPALSALALLIFYGLGQLFLFLRSAIMQLTANRKTKRAAGSGGQYEDAGWYALLALIANGLMLALALAALLGVLDPAYARPPAIPNDATPPIPADVRFDSLATLLGYDVQPVTAHPGDTITIDLYWQVNAQPPGNYLLFAHLIDDAGTMVAQRDTHPGKGNFPTGIWQEGDRFRDSIGIVLPETAYTPATATLTIGLYAPDSYRLAISDQTGQPLGDALALATISLEQKVGLFPNAQDQNFSDEIKLVGYEYNQRDIKRGEDLEVTLYWEALRDLTADYIAQVRLVDDVGRVWAKADGRPPAGTNNWQAGALVADHHNLLPADNIPPGTYRIDIALQEATSGERQNIVGDDGHWIDSHLFLARVRVLP